MKRGINEKNMDQMFPRIHVNDTEKGGPGTRAPPRNKMALYEQLSVPSQRFSSEGGVTMHASDGTNNRHSEINTRLVKQVQQEDFKVLNFVQQSGINLDRSGNHRHKDNETLSPYNLPFSDCLTNVEKSSERNKLKLKETNCCSSFGHRNVSNTNSVRLLCNENSRDHVFDSVDHNIRAVGRRNGGSISGAGVSPDDVVGSMGQKLFWKARKAIINQQRVFAVQVFELHRLIKVQRLIAGLPEIMTDTGAFIGKPTKVSQIEKIPLDYVPKSPANSPKIKDYHEKSKDDKRGLSAENAVEKASLSSVENSNGSALSRYPVSLPDPKMGMWSQQPGQQWLIPVMSPTEGLIYKPYPALGYMTPGPGPPPGHGFVNHGVPPYQWPNGFQPLVHPPVHDYFPPYGITTTNPSSGEEMTPNLFNTQYQSSCNVPTSTTSCSSEGTKTCNALSLFPTCPPAEGPTEPSRVIRVVPRTSKLATESAAWIFRSILEERKQQDLV